MEYEVIIGLEVHAQLKTNTKIFCSCPNKFGAKPNQNTCPICLGHPGVLPVLNRKAVDLAIKAGLALNCDIQERSIWDRKNYFYPDLPKGYQITQFEKPYALGGKVEINVDGNKKIVNLTRIHMEEDAGKLVHDFGDPESSHVDLNRAGTPLVEIVSEPDMRSSAEAGAYMRQLRSTLRYCDVCDGNLEEGSMRCDANVSIRPFGQKEFGTKVEIKNLNSFKNLEKAIDYEIERQKAALSQNKKIVQETRLWNTNKNITESMRSKEDSHDYRYFNDPDLVPLIIDQQKIAQIKTTLPELAEEKASRFVKDYQIPEYDADILTVEKELADYFEIAVKEYNQPKKISNWIMTDLLRELKNAGKSIIESPISAIQIAKMVQLIEDGTISGKIGKTVFEEMFSSGKDPEIIIKEKGLIQVSDTGAIEKVIDEIMKANPNQLEQYRAGKDKLFGFFVGQVMKAMKGQGNPQVVNEILKEKLKG